MNTYRFSKYWFEFAYNNEEVNSNHTAMVFYIIDLANRLNWVEKFGLPTLQSQQTLKMRSYKTYKKTLEDLVDLGVIEILQKSTNQYIATLICFNSALVSALVKNTEPITEASTKASPNQSRHNKTILNYIKTNYKLIETTTKDDYFEEEVKVDFELDIESKKEELKNESLEFLKDLPQDKKNLLKSSGLNNVLVYETERGNVCELTTMAYHAFFEDDTFINLSMQKHRKPKEIIIQGIKSFLFQIQQNESYKQKNNIKELKQHCTNFLNKTITH